MAWESLAIRGYVEVEITRPDGSVDRAAGSNRVVDGGRHLVAQLMAGKASSPAFAIAAGISDKETVADLTKLFDPDGLEPVPVTAVTIKKGVITLRGSFPPAEQERLIKEAGLMLTCTAGDQQVTTLYNRALVTPPQTVRKKEVLTLTWHLSFAPAAPSEP